MLTSPMAITPGTCPSHHEVTAQRGGTLLGTSLLFLALAVSVTAQQPAATFSNPDWTKPFPPFRIIGNIYWVGTYDLSTYLITTPQGHI